MIGTVFTPLPRHALARLSSTALHRGGKELRIASALIVASLGVSLSSHAIADPLAQLSLVWEAPGNCPALSVMQGALRRDLAASSAPPAPLRAEVRISQQSSDRFVVSIVTQGPAGQSRRTLEANTCGEIVNATSLIIATLIDPEGVAQRSQEASKPAEESKATQPTAADVSADEVARPRLQPMPQTPNHVATPSQPTKAQSATPRLEVADRGGAFGMVAGWADLDIGSLSSPTVAIGGLLGWETDGLRIEAQAGWWKPESAAWDRPPNPKAGARFEMIAAEFRACGSVYRRAWLGLYPCAGVEYREMTGRANQFVAEAGQATRRGLAPTFLALATATLARRFAVRVAFGPVFPLDRPEFTVEGLGNLHQPSWVTLRAGIGLEAHFP
jgi:hypothetical protein